MTPRQQTTELKMGMSRRRCVWKI